jgi:hypothetical protein
MWINENRNNVIIKINAENVKLKLNNRKLKI